MKAISNYFAWVVAYIDSASMNLAEQQLSKYPEYQEVEVYIPTVKVLKKDLKGEQFFEEVPLLFNYGFFKIPRKFAIHQEYLEKMRQNVSCIYAWVKDPLKLINGRAKDVHFATASAEEVSGLVHQAISYSAHSSDELDLLKPGDIITLRGYPWDNMQARIIKVDEKKEQIKVDLLIMNSVREVTVSFDNVFFTIYHDPKNYDDSIFLGKSLDEMGEKHTLDKFMAKHNKDGENK